MSSSFPNSFIEYAVGALMAQWLNYRLLRCVLWVRLPHGTNICIAYSCFGSGCCVYEFKCLLCEISRARQSVFILF